MILDSEGIGSSSRGQIHDVVIIGGGVAGLVAAYDLQKRGLDVVVLEAQNYPGGRVRTVHANGFYAEAGGAVITDEEVETLSLLKELSVGPLIDLGLHGSDLFLGSRTVHLTGLDGRIRRPRDLWSWMNFVAAAATGGPEVPFPGPGLLLGYRAAIKAIQKEKAYMRNPPDPTAREHWDTTTFAEFLDRFHPSLRTYVDLQLKVTAGESAERISLYWGLVTFNWNINGSFYWIQGGASRLPLALAEKLGDRLHMNSAVTSVASAEHVSVSYKKESGVNCLSARAAILAAPPSTVLRIVEGLDPQKRAALAAVPFGSYIDVHFVCRQRFWSSKISAGYLNCATTVFADIVDFTKGQEGTGGMLSCFIAGPEARRLIDSSDAAIVCEVVRDLERIFRGALKEVTDCSVYRWREAIPYFHPGYGRLIGDIQRPQDKVFFCGDYTRGAGIHDAVVSGLQAAEQITAHLFPDTKTTKPRR